MGELIMPINDPDGLLTGMNEGSPEESYVFEKLNKRCLNLIHAVPQEPHHINIPKFLIRKKT